MKYVGVCRGVSLDIYYIVTVPYRITVPSIVVALSGDYRWLWQSQPSRQRYIIVFRPMPTPRPS